MMKVGCLRGGDRTALCGGEYEITVCVAGVVRVAREEGQRGTAGMHTHVNVDY